MAVCLHQARETKRHAVQVCAALCTQFKVAGLLTWTLYYYRGGVNLTE